MLVTIQLPWWVYKREVWLSQKCFWANLRVFTCMYHVTSQEECVFEVVRIRERSMHSQKASSKIVCLISVRINQHLVIYLSAVNQTR